MMINTEILILSFFPLLVAIIFQLRESIRLLKIISGDVKDIEKRFVETEQSFKTAWERISTFAQTIAGVLELDG